MEDVLEKAKPLAVKLMNYARDNILVNLRFLDVAVSALTPEQKMGLSGIASDGAKIYYDPVFLLKKYQEEPAFVLRVYLHMLFHLIFFHSFQYDKLDKEAWSLAADMAVEAAVMELDLPGSGLAIDEIRERKLRVIREDLGGDRGASLKEGSVSQGGALTAEKIYRYLKNFGISTRERRELSLLFFMDMHEFWEPKEELAISPEQWKKLSERVRADLKSFSKGKTKSDSIEQNLTQAVRNRYSYKDLLAKFTVMNEDMRINDDEFDYIYYTYGLAQYGNMPLVEPLEYKDSNKIRDFVIAIDTSASCRGGLVKAFLQKTYAILSGEDTFFKKMNVHIIQCDHEVQKDTKITSIDDMNYFLSKEKLTGFGSTDFGPVFEHVEELLAEGEFDNLKGLIYFTDGYGVYPKKMPAYDVMFVFLDNGDEGPEVPAWAVKVLLDYEELEDEY
ncbi:MAG: VWA-like domain-containing protein [Lachnospiraceae bacterium]|nr:VWA-like domain-containing protein [Lachnospiraceae bacterium]